MEQLTRSQLREKIMTILYQIFIYDSSKMKYNVDDVIEEVLEIENNFVKEIVYGVIDKEKEIKNIANEYLSGWTLDRLGKTDQAVLCMAIYELLYTSTPNIVCINEAVELSKKYSDDSVRKMINATLDKIHHNLGDSNE
jgi:transcription antitermination protein NusB